MFKRALFCIAFFLTFLLSTGLAKTSVRKTSEDIERVLKIDSDWLLSNPSLKKAKSSLFTKRNANNIQLFLVSGYPRYITEYSLFIADCETRLIRHLMKNGTDRFLVKQGKDASPSYRGTRIIANPPVQTALIVNSKVVNGQIASWYQIAEETNECPGNHLFFDAKIEANLPDWNQIVSIVDSRKCRNEDKKIVLGIQTDSKALLDRIKPSPPYNGTLPTVQGEQLSGILQDLDSDGIDDVFCCVQQMEDIFEIAAEYRRLYINIEGAWNCVWVELDEVCI